MILCLDIGNTHIFGGVFAEEELKFQFRYPSSSPCTSDQLGVFFKSVLKENDIAPDKITKTGICSVVPSLNYSIRSAFLKYFSLEPFFVQNNHPSKLKIHYENPQEIGADRISNALAGINRFPGKNLIVIDFGTATTFDAINAEGFYLGGIIMPGVHISMKALYENTAKLSPVNIIKPQHIIGQTTIANIQSGLYYGHVGAVREIIKRIQNELFQEEDITIIGTGGFGYLFEEEDLFSTLIPELVLEGIFTAVTTNT